ncbi:MAG TPA: hypothetical protein VN969_33225 [Streptosporangiaceae bacterium]|nr:hypothetical protein [Streptosporangiaceae bacterium]
MSRYPTWTVSTGFGWAAEIQVVPTAAMREPSADADIAPISPVMAGPTRSKPDIFPEPLTLNR